MCYCPCSRNSYKYCCKYSHLSSQFKFFFQKPFLIATPRLILATNIYHNLLFLTRDKKSAAKKVRILSHLVTKSKDFLKCLPVKAVEDTDGRSASGNGRHRALALNLSGASPQLRVGLSGILLRRTVPCTNPTHSTHKAYSIPVNDLPSVSSPT